MNDNSPTDIITEILSDLSWAMAGGGAGESCRSANTASQHAEN